MKIVLANKHFLGVAGGAERNISDLANWLDGKGHQVYILSEAKYGSEPAFPLNDSVIIGNPGLLPPVAKREEASKYREIDVDLSDWLRSSCSLRKKWGQCIREIDPDVIITFLPHTSTFLLYELGQEYPIIVTNQSKPDIIYFPEDEKGDRIELYLRLHLLRYAAKVHFLIPDFVNRMPEFVSEKSIVIPNVVPPPRFGRYRGSLEKSIVALGRLVPDKGFRILIDAFCDTSAYRDGWRLQIFGKGPDEAALRLQIREKMAQRSVFLRGYTNWPQWEMSQSEIFVIPSLYEGWGLSLTEAMSVGLPCIGFEDCSGVNWLIRSGENGLLVPRSTAALTEAIDRLASNQNLRTQLGDEARALTEAFSENEVMRLWDEAILDVTRAAS